MCIRDRCIGAGVLMSEAFGAREMTRLKETLATTLLFGAALCCAAAALGCALTPWILRALAVPDSIFGITGIYLRITFLGAPFTFFYNALAAGLKSVGDSKTPLKFLAFSAVLNAVLDLILIGGLGFGIVCSAVTTVVAEAASALLAAVYMAHRVPELCPGHGQWRIRRGLLGPILRYGAVTALQQAVQPICKVLIQGQVNALGVEAIAAFNAVTRVDDFAFTPEQSIATAITTYIAQNRGAGQTARIRRGFAVGRIAPAVVTFLAGIPGVQTVFPYITATKMQTNYMGLTITELYYGGAFACLPLLWGLAALPLARRRLGSRRDLRTVIRLVLVCTVALAVVDCQMAGMLYRYQSDWLGPLLLAAALANLSGTSHQLS